MAFANNSIKLRPKLDSQNYDTKVDNLKYKKIKSVRDYQDRRHANKYKNKNIHSKRKISMGKKKIKRNSRYNTVSGNNDMPNEFSINKKLLLKKGIKKHPQPNSPPPLPINLQNLSDQKRKEKEDLDFMKNTLKNESEDKPNEFFDFQEKVEFILDLQEDIMNLHLSAIREDAQMLKKESEIISNARNNEEDYEIDNYIRDTEDIVKKKLMLYKQIANKIKEAKKALTEEEESSKKMKNFMYY